MDTSKTSNRRTSVTRKGDCCGTNGVSARDTCDSSVRCCSQIRHDRPPHTKDAPAATRRECPRDRARRGGDCHSDKSNAERESSGAGQSSRGTAKTRTSTRSDHPAGAPPTYHLLLAREKRSAAMKGGGHYRTTQESRQDGVRKLPRHLARATSGQSVP